MAKATTSPISLAAARQTFLRVYSFDYVDADALINVLGVKDGKLTTPAGAQYRVLALDASTQRMSLPLIRKIRDLVDAEAVVVGARPDMTPSLTDDAKEFAGIVERLWDRPRMGRPMQKCLKVPGSRH